VIVTCVTPLGTTKLCALPVKSNVCVAELVHDPKGPHVQPEVQVLCMAEPVGQPVEEVSGCPGVHCSAPEQVPAAVHAHDALHVCDCVFSPHAPHDAVRESPGTHAPVSLPQVLQSLHVPPLHTRTCEPHLPHVCVSLAPALHGIGAQAPYDPHAQVASQVRDCC
jgi:hypothetical protein